MAATDPLGETVRRALEPFPRGLELEELALRAGAPAAPTVRALWSLAWRGVVANDSMRALRRGILAGFEPVGEEAAPESPRRGGLRRWSARRPLPGRWRRLPQAPAGDAVEAESLARDRARWVLDRYGVVFRELLASESPAFSWSRLARSLRTMELSGEIVAGQFFEGVPGLQFATPEALRILRAGLSETALWWLSAADPASPCGIDLPGLKGALPRRLPSTHIVFRGREPLLVSRRSGRELEVRLAPDDPALVDALLPLRSALVRAFDPARAIEIETINGEPAARSPYLVAFADFSVTREGGGGVRLRRRYAGGL
jgi:ATP-dependent Lhr-like helicase